MSKSIEFTDAENNLAEKVNKILEEISNTRIELSKKEESLKELQSFCNHKHYTHHGRQVAEDDPWNECKICGAIF